MGLRLAKGHSRGVTAEHCKGHRNILRTLHGPLGNLDVDGVSATVMLKFRNMMMVVCVWGGGRMSFLGGTC